MLEVPNKAIDKFIKWNLAPFNLLEMFDQKMVEAMLFLRMGPYHLSQHIVDDDLKEFIKGS